MKLRTVHFSLAALLAVSLATGASAQGLYWEMTTTVDGKDGKQTQFSYMPKKYKVEPNDGMLSILRLDQEKMLLVDVGRKRYHEMTFSEMESMMKGVDVQMQEMEKQMDQLPPDQRKMMEELMGKMHPKKEKKAIEVVKAGDTRTINGYHCTKYLLKRGDEQEGVVWATQDIGIPAATWKEMWKDMEQFGKRMAAMMPEGDENIIEKSRSMIDGFPIQTEMKNNITMTVTKIEKRSLPGSVFEVPAGFTKENPPIMKDEKE